MIGGDKSIDFTVELGGLSNRNVLLDVVICLGISDGDNRFIGIGGGIIGGDTGNIVDVAVIFVFSALSKSPKSSSLTILLTVFGGMTTGSTLSFGIDIGAVTAGNAGTGNGSSSTVLANKSDIIELVGLFGGGTVVAVLVVALKSPQSSSLLFAEAIGTLEGI